LRLLLSRWWPPLAIALPALLLSNGRWIVPAAAWLAPVAFLLFLRGLPIRPALLVGAIVWIVAFAVSWWTIVPLPAVAYALFSIGFGLVTFVPFVLHRLFAAGRRTAWSTLLLPASAVAIDFLVSRLSPYGTYASPAYTQVTVGWAAPVASLVGWLGITFLMSWVAAAVTWAWETRVAGGRSRNGLAAIAATIAAVLLYANLVTRSPAGADSVRVAGVIAQLPRELPRLTWGDSATRAARLDTTRLIARAVQDSLVARLDREATKGARILTTSEGNGLVLAADEAAFLTRLEEVARGHRAYLFVGLYVITPGRERIENAVVAIDTQGTERWRIHKLHDLTQPSSPEPARWIDTPYGRLGAEVDFDMAFPDQVRAAGRVGVDLLMAPSSDPPAFDPLATRVAMMRAVENGFALVCEMNHGLSVATDGRGRVLAQIDDWPMYAGPLRAVVPTRHVATLYPRLGDGFAWACVMGVAAMIVALVVPRGGLRRRAAD